MIGIIGGGITGLTLQHFCKEPSFLLEASARFGGLCCTQHTNSELGEFLWDIGGHISKSKHPEITQLIHDLLGDNIVTRRADTKKILFKNKYVDYPFDQGLSALTIDDQYSCVKDYLTRPKFEPANMKEWFIVNFGNSIANFNMIPYSEKLWKWPTDRMNTEWLGRIPGTTPEKIIDSMFGVAREPSYFNYPKVGGFQSIVNALMHISPVNKNRQPSIDQLMGSSGGIARGNPSRERPLAGSGGIARGNPSRERPLAGFAWNDKSRYLDRTVKKIVRDKNWILTDQYNEWHCDELVITCPLPEIARAFVGPEPPSEIYDLKFNSLVVVFLGFAVDWYNEREAIYLAQPDQIAHRVCYPGYFSDSMVPEGCSSLTAEITHLGELDKISDEEIIGRVIDDLSREGIICPFHIVARDLKRVKYAYPIYDLAGYRQRMDVIEGWAKENGISLLGRFGSWKYINSDTCMIESMDWIRESRLSG